VYSKRIYIVLWLIFYPCYAKNTAGAVPSAKPFEGLRLPLGSSHMGAEKLRFTAWPLRHLRMIGIKMSCRRQQGHNNIHASTSVAAAAPAAAAAAAKTYERH